MDRREGGRGRRHCTRHCRRSGPALTSRFILHQVQQYLDEYHIKLGQLLDGLSQAPNEGTLLERQDDDTIRIALRSRGVCRRSSARRPAWRVTRLHNTTCSTRLTRSCAGLR